MMRRSFWVSAMRVYFVVRGGSLASPSAISRARGSSPLAGTISLTAPQALAVRYLRTADHEQPSRSDWTCAANRAVVQVRACHEALLPRWPLGHCGVVLVTADAVEARGEHHGKAYRYPADRLVGGGSARRRGRGRCSEDEQGDGFESWSEPRYAQADARGAFKAWYARLAGG